MQVGILRPDLFLPLVLGDPPPLFQVFDRKTPLFSLFSLFSPFWDITPIARHRCSRESSYLLFYSILFFFSILFYTTINMMLVPLKHIEKGDFGSHEF